MTTTRLDFTGADATYANLVTALQLGVTYAAHPFHLFTLATVSLESGPEARTVVLRRVEPEQHTLWFHTDSRSPKFAQLQRDPRACLHFYHFAERWQVRLTATVQLHRADTVAEAAWEASRPESRGGYALPAPGSPLDLDAPATLPLPVAADDAPAYAHFVAAACRFRVIDMVWLNEKGNCRVVMTWAGDGWSLQRVAP